MATSTLGLFAQDQVNTPGAFYQWQTGPSGFRTAGFFDGPSDDTPGGPLPGCALANYMTGTQRSDCQLWGGSTFSFTPVGPLRFLANQGSSATPVPFTITPSCSIPRRVSLDVVVTGYNQAQNQPDVFGYYLLSAPNTLVPLFTASAVPASNTFTPTGEFGFYLTSGEGTTYKSGDASNGNFVLFAQDPAIPNSPYKLRKYFVGSEDRAVPGNNYALPPTPIPSSVTGRPYDTDADYNDMAVSVTVQPCSFTSCTLTQGGYKNNFADKVVSLQLGNKVYTTAQINSILNTPVRGNGLISLAYQLIAAKLNVYYLNPALVPASITQAIAAADALIGNKVIPPVGTDSLPTSSVSTLVTMLDDFNNGILGPGHCN